MIEQMNSIHNLQIALRQQGEFDAADALSDVGIGLRKGDLEFQLAYYRLVRECGYIISFLREDAAGVYEAILMKLTPEDQEVAILLCRASMNSKATTSEEKMLEMVDAALALSQSMTMPSEKLLAEEDVNSHASK